MENSKITNNDKLLHIKYKLLDIKNKRIWHKHFSLEELKKAFNFSNNTNFQELISYLNDKNLSVGISCDNKDIFLEELEDYIISQRKNEYKIAPQELRLEIIREIKSYNTFLLNMNSSEDFILEQIKNKIFVFSKKEIMEIKKKIRYKYRPN